MSFEFEPADGDRMESFFDNLMSEQEAADFLAEKRNDSAFLAHWQAQKNIDSRLKEIFSFQSTPENLEASFTEPIQNNQIATANAQSWYRVAKLVLAASLMALLVWGAMRLSNRGSQVVFQEVALPLIYDETVASGFVPYYECHDMQRFAKTFLHRHGVALSLAKMPDDRRMLGLSYLGGVSRDATSMLCKVDGLPVLVFVDNVANDRSGLINSDEEELNVFRAEKFGLIFYEVSPLKESTMVRFFQLADPSLVNGS